MRKKATKKGAKVLNKTQKSEVKKIAAATVAAIAEDKYMNCSRIIGEKPVSSAIGFSRIGVLGYSTSLSNTPGGIQLTYGYEANQTQKPMLELNMLRPFVQQTGNAQTDNYAIEGRECRPRSASCHWRFSRDIGQILSAVSETTYNSQETSPPLNLASNLPIIFRIIRATPKQPQANVLCDPKEDLFLDQFGTAVGIDTGSFDDTELLSYRTNKRRYNVIEDKFFRLQNGLTVEWQRSILSHGGSGVNSATRAVLQPSITNTNANCEKTMTTRHILTAKKNGSVFYDAPEASALAAPSSGHKREFVLIHAIYAGAETYLDDNVADPNFPDDVKITASPLVKFIDV